MISNKAKYISDFFHVQINEIFLQLLSWFLLHYLFASSRHIHTVNKNVVCSYSDGSFMMGLCVTALGRFST